MEEEHIRHLGEKQFCVQINFEFRFSSYFFHKHKVS